MVSFSCEGCGDVLTKKKLDPHRNQCYGASYTCLDCMVHFQGTEYRSHTSCITEDQKYQGKLYKEKKGKHQKQNSQSQNNSQALVPRKPYVEDVPDDDRVAIVNAPPHAPSPPPCKNALEAPDNVNVFDFLVGDSTPNASRVDLSTAVDESRMIEDSRPPEYTEFEEEPSTSRRHRDEPAPNDSQSSFSRNGFSYGDTPVEPRFQRYDSYSNIPAEHSPPPDASQYYTPAPKHDIREPRYMDTAPSTNGKSDKKRKRASVEALDMALVRAQAERDAVMTDAPPLHSGLTGGLSRMLARPEFPPSPDYSGGDWVDASPLSPMKRSKQTHVERDRGREREQKPRKVSVKSHLANGAWVRHKKRDRDDSRKERGRRRGEDERRRRQRSNSSASRSGDDDYLDHPRAVKPLKAIEYRRTRSPSTQAREDNAMVLHSTASKGNGVLAAPKKLNGNSEALSVSEARVDLFTSFVTKGPDSERGCSVNKVLKRFHRERSERWDKGASWGGMSKMEEEKELWKSIRLKKNDRGEIVLFFDE